MNLETTTATNAWDTDFEEMDENPVEEEGGDSIQPIPTTNIKRPIHKSPPLKILVLFSGAAALAGGVAFAFFGGSFTTEEKKIAKSPKPAEKKALSTSDQERLANAEAANAMRGNRKALETHNQDNQDKKEPAKTTESDTNQKTDPDTAPPPVKPVITPPVVYQPPVKPVIAPLPVVYQQPKVDKPNQEALIKSLTSKVDNLTFALKRQEAQPISLKSADKLIAAKPIVREIPAQPPVKPSTTPSVVFRPDKNQEALVKSLTSKVDNLTFALKRQEAQPISLRPADKTTAAKTAAPAQPPVKPSTTPFVVSQPDKRQEALIKSLAARIDSQAIALQQQNTQLKNLQTLDKLPKEIPPASIAQVEKPIAEIPAPLPQIQQVVQIVPSIEGRAVAKLFDAVTISSDNNNAAQNLVRIQLSQSIPTSDGLEIPTGSIVAMNITVASNGMVTGSSVGVWDVKTQKQLNVQRGALVIEGLKGQPLIAQSIKTNDSGVADNQVAIWGAIGAGVDGLTRPDSSSTITTGTLSSTTTSGGSRDLLANAAGGFAKARATSLEREAARRRDKISAQSELWHLPQNTEVVVSVRPLPNSKFLTATRNQYQQVVDIGEIPIPKRYAVSLGDRR
jgi:Fe2+ transport system protein FeoA